MKPARFWRYASAAGIAACLTACATTTSHPGAMPRAAVTAQADVTTQQAVSVRYLNPHDFTESHQLGLGIAFDHDQYMAQLRTFLVRKATPLLEPGQHLSITFTNIDLAGGYEPWRGPRMGNVRIMSRMYPPRFDFTFQLTDANGKVIGAGTRKLTNLTYLMDQAARPGDSDPLRYDKGLLERWLRRGPAKW